MKNTRKNKAVSDVVATFMLLAIAISLFAIVQVIATEIPLNINPPNTRLVAYAKDDTIYINHGGGESLPLDTEIKFVINGSIIKSKIIDNILDYSNSNGDNVWNIGEKVSYKDNSLIGSTVDVIIFDDKTNSFIFFGTIEVN